MDTFDIPAKIQTSKEQNSLRTQQRTLPLRRFVRIHQPVHRLNLDPKFKILLLIFSRREMLYQIMESQVYEELSVYEKPEEWLNKLINRDGCFKDLATRLDFENSAKIGISGIRELDYPTMHFHGGGELEATKSFSLPPELLEKFSGMQNNCLMGIFTCCERAWVTVDNEIFMWNYEDGEDLAYYDGITDTIVCVGLATPRPGVLPEQIRHLLCLATPLEIFVLGMTYSQEHTGSNTAVLQLMPDPLYCIPTDNLNLVCMESTDSGRIFFGTLEGSLLELDYRPIPGWRRDSTQLILDGRTGPCTLVNHSASALGLLLPSVLTSSFRSTDAIQQLVCDPVRNLLYARTEDSNLTVYEYSPASSLNRGSLSKLAHLAARDLAYSASTFVRSVDKAQFRSLASIVPISTGRCHLMAVTKTGIRLYFGENLKLLHIRMPPNSPYGRGGLGEVKLVAETRGTTVLVSSLPSQALSSNSSFTTPFSDLPTISADYPTADPLMTDSSRVEFNNTSYVLYTLSPDPFPWTPNLSEVCSAAWCVGGAWALVVLPQRDAYPASPGGPVATQSHSSPRGQPPVVLTQHLDPPFRRLVLISAHGLVHLRLPNPLYRLKEFLMRELSFGPGHQLNPLGLQQPIRTSYIFPSVGNQLDDQSPVADPGFLSAYMYQFSPDEAICAVLTIGAAQAVTSEGISEMQIEQTALYFAAEAARFWVPAVKCATSFNLLQHPITSSRTASPLTDKTLSSGLFLFSGICTFLARMGRTFWRSPLFRDAAIHSPGGALPGSGLRSWMQTFVNVLASASPLRSARSEQRTPHPIISRLESNDISWLTHQLTFLQDFLRRQLVNRGGWFRADSSSLVHPSGDASAGDHMDLVLLQRLAEDLDKLLGVTLEVLKFWKILSEHAVHKILERLSDDQRNILIHMPMETYATSLLDYPRSSRKSTDSSPGVNVTCAVETINTLLNALIDYYLTELADDGDHLGECANLDRITERLQAACPMLFANEDALSAKASECLIQVTALRSLMTSQSSNAVSVEDVQHQVEQLISNALDLYMEAGPGILLDSAVPRLIGVGAWREAIALCLAVAAKRDPKDVAVECLKTGRRPSAEPASSLPGTVDRRSRAHWFAQSELATTEGRYDAYHHLICCLQRLWEASCLPTGVTHLSPPSSPQTESSDLNPSETDLAPTAARSLLFTILEEINQTTDILAHFEIFNWLMTRGLTDTVLRLNSPHLEGYLRSRLRQTPDDPDLRCLLWRTLEHRGARLEAAQVLEHLAVTPCDRLTLEARLDFAARAIVTLKALPVAQQDVEYLHDLEVRLELAQLQHQLYTELCQLSSRKWGSPRSPRSMTRGALDEELNEAKLQLSHGPLLTLSELFTDYADKFGLNESKLVLLWAGDSQDAVLIKAIWRELLQGILSGRDSEARTPPRHSPAVRGLDAGRNNRRSDNSHRRLIELALVECLARLGDRFSIEGSLSSAKSQLFFPLAEITSTLEYYAIHQKLSADWFPTLMRDTRLLCSANLIEAYDQLLHCKDLFWRRAEIHSRLLTGFAIVAEDYLRVVCIQLSARQRMLQTGKILDRVTGILVDLNSEVTKELGDTEEVHKGTERITDRLRRVHDQLQRFYR